MLFKMSTNTICAAGGDAVLCFGGRRVAIMVSSVDSWL